MKKNVCINGKCFSRPLIGVGRYTNEILKEMDKLIDSQSKYELVIPVGVKNVPDFKNIKIVEYGENSPLWTQVDFLHYVIKRRGITLNLDGNPPFLYPCITCKHDMTHRINPQVYISNDKKRKKMFFNHLIVDFSLRLFAKKILTVSETSKKDIIKYYRCKPDRVEVIGNAWQHFKEIEEDDNIFVKNPEIDIEKYYFCLGAQNRNKNFQWIIENSKLYSNYQFVVAGLNSSNISNGDLYCNNSNIIYLGYVSDSELMALFSHCKAFVFPSLYEGFGIPPMEALSVGKSAIVSDIECLREIYGEAVYYIDPYKPNINLDDLLNYMIDDTKIQEILNKYSWEKSAQKLVSIIKQINGEKHEI